MEELIRIPLKVIDSLLDRIAACDWAGVAAVAGSLREAAEDDAPHHFKTDRPTKKRG